MKVLTCSRHFPKDHPRATQPTFFVEQILNAILPRGANGIINRDDIRPEILPYINDFVLLDGTTYKHHTIRAGSRWKAGDMASLRVWSGAPYRSKQIEFAQVEVKRTWEFRILFEPFHKAIFYLNGNELPVSATGQLAKNDGLSEQDFLDWFKIHPKSKGFEFPGQIITWSSVIDYTSLTEKANA